MEQFQQQLNDSCQIYSTLEENLKTGFEAFQRKIQDFLDAIEVEKTPNAKAKRARQKAAIPEEEPESEETEADSTINTSQRPVRSTRTKNATSYKEPSLHTKIRRPSPEKQIKKERITIEGGKENREPNKTSLVNETDESVTIESGKKLTDTQSVEIIETPVETVVILSEDETDKMPPPLMPPPLMPPPKARGRPRTRKAAQKEENEIPADTSIVKQERISTDESIVETKKETKSKKKKGVPMPIQEPAVVKTEKVSPAKSTRPSGGSETSVYEEATSTKNSLEAPQIMNSTVTINNATFDTAKGNETFDVKSPQESNATFDVPPATPTVHDSIMTEDRSDEENDLIAKLLAKSPEKPKIAQNKKHEIFNPNIASPLKEKVQAFEKLAANNFMSPMMMKQKTRQIMTPSGMKLTTPMSLPRIPSFKPASAHAGLASSISAPLAHKKVVSKPSTSSNSTTSSRDPSVEDLRRTANAIEAKKKAREEKQRLVQQQREQLEKERRERAQQLQKEKEEKHRKLLEEKEARKRELMSQKKLEEHLRNQKMLDQKRRELMEKEALEAAKNKHNESLQRRVLEKQHAAASAKTKVKHDFEALDTDDSTDDEGKMHKNRLPPPIWSKSANRRHTTRNQTYVSLRLVDKFFSVQPMTPDLKEIFPDIEPKKLKRNSSAVWNTPPRYSQMPKY
ncbi:transcription initiation factor TFIID subunit 3-like [Culicoides brevitarsis]|uniref:transcription initiation factor TFIID subunit 3-like n=1 Tax=Culicoides brevitarsis TaxID=469753 RepID=UPI00307BB417